MHIPDGFLSPATYLSGYAVAAVAWYGAARGLRQRLDEATVPRLATLTGLAYVLGLIMVPIPGGTSGHLIGVAWLSLVFGPRLAFLSHSLVLGLQSLLLGAGGITALPINALAMGGMGSVVACAVFRLVRPVHEAAAVLVASWLSVMVSAALVALVLGAQPLVAQGTDGLPLFFPFGWPVVMPAVLLPHAVIGVVEALLTLALWRYARQRHWLAA